MLCRGGQVRSRVEVALMAMERRDLATAVGIKSQLNLGGTFETNKTLWHFQTTGYASLS